MPRNTAIGMLESKKKYVPVARKYRRPRTYVVTTAAWSSRSRQRSTVPQANQEQHQIHMGGKNCVIAISLPT